MFVKEFNQLTEEICRELKYGTSDLFLIYDATRIWCNKLDIPQDITDYILAGYRQFSDIQNLISYLYQEWEPQKEKKKINFFYTETINKKSRLNYILAAILNRINLKEKPMTIIVIIALCTTAIGYWIHKINHTKQKVKQIKKQPQKLNTTRNIDEYEYIDNHPSYKVTEFTKKNLVLVISAEKPDFIESLRTKNNINVNDSEELYEMTKYLWLGSSHENEFTQKIDNIKAQYSVPNGKESEYDIHLLSINLKQPEHRFKKNTDQLDRYDAFRELSNLVVNFDISPRLQMEAYTNFEVYNR